MVFSVFCTAIYFLLQSGDISALHRTKSDVWVEDCSIAAIIIQLTALSLGLGSCWAQMRNRNHSYEIAAETYVQELLGLPEHIKVECILGIGYPAEQKESVSPQSLQNDKIRNNHW
jgi:nitroreductase